MQEVMDLNLAQKSVCFTTLGKSFNLSALIFSVFGCEH